ncbi:MAG: GNAT family N-acetyltransferase [Mariniblastus sp.]
MQTFQTPSTPIQLAVVAQTAQSHTNAAQLRATWVDASELRSRLVAWHSLASNALRPNASFESNFLLPALEHLADDSIRVLIVDDVQADKHNNLVALVPIQRKQVYRLPFNAAEIWKHEQSFDSTPLLHKQHATEAWQLICDKLISDGFSLLSLDTVSGEPDIDQVFKATEKNQGIVRFQRDHFQRAAFTPSDTPGDYVTKHVSKSIRKNSRRLFRRLEDLGTVTWETSAPSSDFEQLTKYFLKIEASGWKGREGTALASNESTKTFYEQLIRESAEDGKARFLSLKLDGRPIAMLSDIQSGNVVFSYKTAYDEEFASFSPGQQIEVKNLEYLHRDGIALGDSCTVSNNSTINRIWGQKLTFQNLILSLTPGLARTAVRALPIIQSAVHRLRKN